jgi:hypothetical protein
MWLMLFTVQATREVVNGGPSSILTLIMTYLILILLILIVLLAYPRLRITYHNNFEVSHRFFGWFAVALVWVQVRSQNLQPHIVLNNYTQTVSLINDNRAPGQTLGNACVTAATFWLVLILTISIILPWLRLRKVPVRAEVLSKHCVRLWFDYGSASI